MVITVTKVPQDDSDFDDKDEIGDHDSVLTTIRMMNQDHSVLNDDYSDYGDNNENDDSG